MVKLTGHSFSLVPFSREDWNEYEFIHLNVVHKYGNMDKLVGDLENAIWSKSGGQSEPSGSFCDEKDATNLSPGDQMSRTAVLGNTVCYIVSAVVLSEGRVLMMREAKKSCRGTWYLPAGRVEKC